jgi:hypothetical protein
MVKKKFISIVATLGLVLTLALVPVASPVMAAEGTASGSFQVGNVAPTITSVEVIPAAGGSAVTSMTPGTAYKAKIVVNDANTVNDTAQVRVAIVFDSADSDPVTDPGETGNTQTLACLKWVKSTDTWSISPTGGTPATTWSITSGSCTKPSNMTLTTGTWEFYFTVGKVATEGIGGAGNAGWDLFGEVNDEGTPVEMWDDRDLAMEWYGEVTVNTASVDWGSVSPGMDFAEDDPSEEVNINVTYLANGDYDEKVGASQNWTSASGNATLNTTASPGAGEFSLKADNTTNLANAVNVTASPTYTTIDNTGTQTDDDGEDVTTNSLWLKLGTSFTEATYTGTIYYQVANG